MSPSRPLSRSAPWIRVGLLLLALALAFFALGQIGDVVQLVLVSVLLAYLLDPLVVRVESFGMRRTSAVALLFVAIALSLAGLTALVLPLVTAQVRGVQEGLGVETVAAAVEGMEAQLNGQLGRFGVAPVDLMGLLQEYAAERFTEGALEVVPGLMSMVVALIVVPFIMFFLLRDAQALKKAFVSVVPNRYFEFSLLVLYRADQQVGGYLRGQIITSTIVGVLSIFALWLIGVDYFVLIGTFAGLTNLIPYLGPVAGATVAVLVSAISTGSFVDAPLIVVAFAAIQLLDNVALQPTILARNVELHPLLILLTLLIAGQFVGVVGLLLAIPVVAVLKVLLHETFRNLHRFQVD